MYSFNEYKKLTSKYGSVASWAIWDDEDLSNTSPIELNFNELNSKFILLGLNISKPLMSKPWTNFHSGRHDRKLKYACNHSTLRGSYLTDIFKGIDNPNSADFSKSLTIKDIRDNVDFFMQEMIDVKINEETQFIIFGNLTNQYFNKYFRQNYKNNVIHFRHYSSRGTDKEWVTQFLEKVEYRSKL